MKQMSLESAGKAEWLSMVRRFGGSLFQTVGPQTENARFPNSSNYGTILYPVSVPRQREILVENCNFFHTPLVFDAPIRGTEKPARMVVHQSVKKV